MWSAPLGMLVGVLAFVVFPAFWRYLFALGALLVLGWIYHAVLVEPLALSGAQAMAAEKAWLNFVFFCGGAAISISALAFVEDWDEPD